jgi:uncharacterized paraquat-inducible protein A
MSNRRYVWQSFSPEMQDKYSHDEGYYYTYCEHCEEETEHEDCTCCVCDSLNE